MRPERNEERYSRQKDIVPAERIDACKATVIGVEGRDRLVHRALEPKQGILSLWDSPQNIASLTKRKGISTKFQRFFDVASALPRAT